MTRPHRGTGDEGTSLVEMLVAVVVLGIGVTGLLSALAFLLSATYQHRQLAEANTVAIRAMEVVADPVQTPFVESCDNVEEAYLAEVPAQVAIEKVEEWFGDSWQKCSGRPTLPLQRITLTASSPDGAGVVTMSVVKRGEP